MKALSGVIFVAGIVVFGIPPLGCHLLGMKITSFNEDLIEALGTLTLIIGAGVYGIGEWLENKRQKKKPSNN